jgi:mannose-6-phosphate isomerase-like protein (cupin superfamily)
MSDYTIKRIREMEGYYLGAMKRARAELGVTSFGLQVLQMPPNITAYPEHDHAGSGQEEVFIPIAGSGEIELDGERHPLTEGMMVRVGPEVTRKIWPGDAGIRLIAIGGIPGKPYEVPAVTELGAPDPMAS